MNLPRKLELQILKIKLNKMSEIEKFDFNTILNIIARKIVDNKNKLHSNMLKEEKKAIIEEVFHTIYNYMIEILVYNKEVSLLLDDFGQDRKYQFDQSKILIETEHNVGKPLYLFNASSLIDVRTLDDFEITEEHENYEYHQKLRTQLEKEHLDYMTLLNITGNLEEIAIEEYKKEGYFPIRKITIPKISNEKNERIDFFNPKGIQRYSKRR